jgi:hypothetical protein
MSRRPTCSNGRANPNKQVTLRLFADAAGYCQRPGCRKRLFSEEDGEDYHLAEMAHIFAASDDGPRARSSLSREDRAKYENLILLCPNCHTEIDKAPNTFPDLLVLEWKKKHKEIIKNSLGIAQLESREQINAFITPLLNCNKKIFETLGPDNDYHHNPEAEEANSWKRKILTQIIPNNQKILLTIDANIHLAKADELDTIESFRQHVDDLIQRHLGENTSIASRFPIKMNNIFKD